MYRGRGLAGYRSKKLAGKVNGYAGLCAILALGIVAATVSLILVRAQNRILLRQAQVMNTFKLSLLDQSSRFWLNNEYERRCRKVGPEAEKDIIVQDRSIHLTDNGTNVEADFAGGSLILYMDSQGIVSAEWRFDSH